MTYSYVFSFPYLFDINHVTNAYTMTSITSTIILLYLPRLRKLLLEENIIAMFDGVIGSDLPILTRKDLLDLGIVQVGFLK